ncbi:response regulator [Coleofasciculus sp. G2-EDA-02]|uniref:response regulator n=1 Tax=Coleofasciculus sp. G2-EDA-02 TaxID=3069529 RepID=UPI0032FF746E
MKQDATILVIEDEEILRDIILNVLQEKGYQAIGTGDSRRGLLLAKEFVPDLILCDIRMPKLDGYEVLKALRQDSKTRTIPLIFISAEKNQSVRHIGQHFGANGYLAKPFTTDELLTVIVNHINFDQ